jgi:beta-lactam-binding protein with PASTA domain
LVGALALALLAVVGSGVALWRTFDVQSTSAPDATVPAGPVLVEVPSEINKNGMLAVEELASLKLVAVVTTGPSVTTRTNFVINQDPAPGTMVEEGTSVNLKVSSGPT